MADIIVCSAAEEDFSKCLGWYAEQSEQAAIDFDAEVTNGRVIRVVLRQAIFAY